MGYQTDVARQIARILEEAGVGTYNTDIFISKEPASPDNCLTIYNTGGQPDDCLDLTHRSSEITNFQVRVRNNDYFDCHTKMESVRSVIEKTVTSILNSDERIYFRIWMTTLPLSLQRDTSNRAIITSNFSCMRWVDTSIYNNFSSSSSSSSDSSESSSSSSSDSSESSSSN